MNNMLLTSFNEMNASARKTSNSSYDGYTICHKFKQNHENGWNHVIWLGNLIKKINSIKKKCPRE
jgi:hypothetical protein